MEFNFPPQNLAEVFGFFTVMFIVMLVFYFLGSGCTTPDTVRR